MMKNKKLMIVFILIVAFLLVMATYTKASDETGGLQLVTGGNNQNSLQNEQGNNNEEGNNEIKGNNIANISGNTNTANNTTLPQTGIASDTTLFIFIGVCIASAVYAYIKIKNYNNVD